jgi:hypothetical protein
VASIVDASVCTFRVHGDDQLGQARLGIASGLWTVSRT